MNRFQISNLFLIALFLGLAACQTPSTTLPLAPTATLLPPTATSQPAATAMPAPTNPSAPPPTDTPLPAPTSLTLGKGECVELVQNGDFETGQAAPWVETNSLNQPLVIEFPGRGNGSKYSAFMGSASNVDASISQEVMIPNNAATVTLTYWWAHGSHERDGQPHDFMRVTLQGPSGADLAALEEISNATSPDRQFSESTQDLAAYVGKSVRVVFHVTTDAQNDTDFFVDDVSVQACGPK